jgi:hypothetical protein
LSDFRGENDEGTLAESNSIVCDDILFKIWTDEGGEIGGMSREATVVVDHGKRSKREILWRWSGYGDDWKDWWVER